MLLTFMHNETNIKLMIKLRVYTYCSLPEKYDDHLDIEAQM